MATLIRSDLDFILEQIRIALTGNDDGSGTLGSGPNQVADATLPFGLRTVTGRFNNLIVGQDLYGAADTPFLHLVPQVFRNDLDGDTIEFDINGPAPGGLVTLSNTNYATSDDIVDGSGFFVSGDVVDADPRLISNLIVDQTASNPAAAAVYRALNELGPNDPLPSGSLFIQNVAPDAGLSAPFNSWFTLFGQFFDHGLDLVSKGGEGVVYIPLAEDDPLRTHGMDGIQGNGDEVPASRAFMVMTRATNVSVNAGQDGLLGTSDDIHLHNNITTAFVDQNQTYTSHPSHQAFLREYVLDPATGAPVATGHLLEGAGGGLATWADIKAQARNILGIDLGDLDVTDVPLLATDAYGQLILTNNRAVLITGAGAVEGQPLSLGGTPVSTANAVRTGHAFLDDIAHNADPRFDHDRNPNTGKIAATPDGDTTAGSTTAALPTGVYDNELLDAHFVTGDGRGNENIGLTAVHHVFHSEHNRQVEEIKDVVVSAVASAVGGNAVDLQFVQGYTLAGANLNDGIQAGEWNGEALFQAARFATEMQYQHLVFEEFARKLMPAINPFSAYETDVDPSIVGEFAHTVYRFGHSMLTETVDRTNADGSTNNIGLIPAFLNPLEFLDGGTYANADAAAGAIVRGMTRQVGNEIDEFVVGAVRSNLLGLPLDLAAINIARGRDTGIPTLNEARLRFYNALDLNAEARAYLKPYESWAEFGLNIKHPESLINFIAAYGTHASVAGATTLEGKRDAATLLVLGNTDIDGDGVSEVAPNDRVDFMNSTGTWANTGFGVTTTGLNAIDFWIGGLAEKAPPFGGMLGSTFGFVFETTMEALQNGDRFYYLSRTAGENFLGELEANSFAELIMKNTTGAGFLPGDVFSRPDYIIEAANPANDPVGDGLVPGTPLVVRSPDGTVRFTGDQHVVMGGTAGNDRLIAGEGDDTLWGMEGNDKLEGGAGNDAIHGGDGDDIITDSFGDDNIKGEDGDDAIDSGPGLDLVLGGSGNDFIRAGNNETEIFAGRDDDILLGGDSINTFFGNEGNDWLEGGGGADLLQGDNGAPFQQSPLQGHDILIGGSGNDDYDAESGDDIMVTGAGIERNEGMLGFDWVTNRGDASLGANVGIENDMLLTGLVADAELLGDIRDRFDLVEGLSGWNNNDILRGDNHNNATEAIVGHELGAAGIARIAGLQGLLDSTTEADTDTVGGFNEGNILLGGGGSDLIEGRGGNDIIDGDAWLNVQLSYIDANNVEQFVDSAAPLQALVFSGELDPGNIRVVRQIEHAAGPDNDIAQFGDVIGGYTFTRVNGAIRVAHSNATVGVPNDGTDILRNIETLRFSDGAGGFVDVAVNALPGIAPLAPNQAATGTIAVTNSTPPTEGVAMVATAALADANDGVNAASVRLVWQVETTPGNWTTVRTGSTFAPDDAQAGKAIRVVASFEDNLGYRETVTENVGIVGDINDAPAGTDNTVVTNEDQPLTLTAAMFGFTDPDAGDSLSAVVITTLPGTGTLTLAGNPVIAGATVTLVELDAGDLVYTPPLDATGQGLAALTFQVQDFVGTSDPTPNTLTINVLAENDAPASVGAARSIAEDTSYTFVTADFAFIDLDTANGDQLRAVRIDTLPAAGVLTLDGNPVAAGQVILAPVDGNGAPQITGLVYTPVANDHTDHSFTFSVQDLAGAFSASETFAINVTPVNDAPTGAAVISDVTPTEGTAVTVDTATIADIDGLGPFAYQWQAFIGSSWVNVGTNAASFTPTQLEVNAPLRVVVGYTDVDGTAETVTSAATAVVGDLFVGNNLVNVRTFTPGADSAQGLGGNDNFSSLAGDDTLDGGAGADALDGGEGDDTLIGGSTDGGADTLIGGAGADSMTGGAGADIYHVDSLLDTVVELAGGGTDEIQTTLTTFTLDVTAGSVNVEHLNYAGTGTEAFTGTGNAVANRIDGGDGNDRLTGLGGTDSLIGGLGDDTYVFVGGVDNVFEDPGQGTDTIESDVTVNMGAGQLAAQEIERLLLTGSGNINGTGNTLANQITGNSGNNVLDGGLDTAIDTLTGGGGNDTYVVRHAGDVVVEAAGGGTDIVSVVASASFNAYTLDAEVETLQASAATALALTFTGNGLANTITGSNGNDTLDGGAGNDTLNGGAGSDTFLVDSTADVVTDAGAGTDTVLSTANVYTVTDGDVEVLTFVGTGDFTGTGNTAANTITGGAGNDRLTGLGGADTVIGGLGDDTYVFVGALDTVTEAAGEGNDTVESNVTVSIAAGQLATQELENVTLVGTAAINATGNALANVLTGNSGNNILDGGLNTLGVDTLVGGDGNDTYIVRNAGDVVSETGTGTDVVQTSLATYLLDAGVENLTVITGGPAVARNFTGNGLGNTITANGGNDTLNGGAGNDTLNGGTGEDTFVAGIGDGNDTYNGGGNVDTYDISATTATSSITTTAASSSQIGNDVLSSIENIIGGQGVDVITVNGADNNIDGQGGSDIINAGAGNDTLAGGADDDLLTGGTGFDVFVFAAGFGNDTITGPNAGERFDAIGTGPTDQDLIDLQALGITSANFASRVLETAGADTLLTILAADLTTVEGTITIIGVADSAIDQTDFRLAV